MKTDQTKPAGQRKKKAARACIHCQKAHLTCDDSRPCQRCIKRNLATTCTDGARKKAKYLQDIEGSPSIAALTNDNANRNSSYNYGFGSNATNLEYSILSNMLGSPLTDTVPNAQTPTSADVLNNICPVTASTGPAVRRRNQIITPEMAYASATKPFSYADGYHYLINYVKTRMSREDLMRISRALALFRPSVLASMMNLTEDDLVFTEKCLQRTLLEYEKLISYSGTPTVVWRRTGEITLVGKEFSLLTQWSRDMLLSKKTYIYELMSNPSAVEYWEKYALHAFDNTDSAVYSTCILMSPTKRIVPCTFCFTIKRDIFDLPSVIVGNVSVRTAMGGVDQKLT
ncbi:Zn(2)-C6 fungal-specific transcription factor [Mucor lusitanicus CBS 277.49]|uniref:Zn(2)-C6 fungal-specific transcription factor n=1 Tax=Mucor lusitanicus CBS 277.49 TaxID=747725 RepID=A0A168GJY5_MUCCL|nr:Zn(2)-C6 fungal-specific transcription factor [Mucor lusitanicus CBS 277.49]